jgi:ATP-dependent protease ClpP protease subunit
MKWASKKRKTHHVAEDDHDDDPPISLPLLISKSNTSSVYSHNNHIYFNDDITDDTTFALNKELRLVETKLKMITATLGTDPTQPIYLHITTNGGSIHAAFTVVDCIKSLSLPVYTVVEGFVASAGTLISLAGEKRYVTKNAYMLIHELRSGVWGKMSEIDEEYKNLKKMMDHIISYYNEYTSLSKKRLEKILTKDSIWNATESIENGLAQEVWSTQPGR